MCAYVSLRPAPLGRKIPCPALRASPINGQGANMCADGGSGRGHPPVTHQRRVWFDGEPCEGTLPCWGLEW